MPPLEPELAFLPHKCNLNGGKILFGYKCEGGKDGFQKYPFYNKIMTNLAKDWKCQYLN